MIILNFALKRESPVFWRQIINAWFSSQLFHKRVCCIFLQKFVKINCFLCSSVCYSIFVSVAKPVNAIRAGRNARRKFAVSLPVGTKKAFRNCTSFLRNVGFNIISYSCIFFCITRFEPVKYPCRIRTGCNTKTTADAPFIVN